MVKTTFIFTPDFLIKQLLVSLFARAIGLQQ
jgi:hypothetical protein